MNVNTFVILLGAGFVIAPLLGFWLAEHPPRIRDPRAWWHERLSQFGSYRQGDS